ncbi:choice-of-anchor I family protein [Paenibacillus sp. LHD-117]|uniref:choice-of-anchor I family protein n=1 Tax=Paenibacillus sp. LHD-117 TaxID=3071412 RepID=UPI0027DF02D3|nr:choice-of-anchor I family protein [Paenibacillus sp. LHD-117]MDQ6418801.1 choice-of-anchor I family protein [Paenibacillus sp. LHD-117]
MSTVIATQLALGTVWGGSAVFADGAEADGLQSYYAMNKIGSYSVGTHNEDGGVAEIVKFNKENGKFYLVNGSSNPPSLDIVELGSGDGELKKVGTVLVKELAETNGFKFGDLTSVAISNANDLVYVAVQEADPHKAGKILALSYDGKLVREYAAGIQPDMIIVTEDGKYVLTADEAEHRTGVKGQDPKGSVTIVNTTDGKSAQAYFDNPAVIADDVHIRGQANADGIVDGKGTKADASFDFEPEYIALSSDNGTAYVTLQENNAIATVDIAKGEVTSVKSLGLKDYNDPANALDIRKDGEFSLENVPFYGVYMPDGLASYEVGGKTYLLTANEGDATEWPDRVNASEVGELKGALDPASEAYKFLQDTEDFDGVEVMTDRGNDGIYMYGGRSFSVWDASTMEQVYDSGSEFEEITALAVPDFFNTSNSKARFDDRSGKKGPEPEEIKTGMIGDRTFAFVGLERVGGIMMYDVTDPTVPAFESYVNTREFADAEGEVILDTDTGPEGIEFIPAADSPTGNPLLLVAFEVGGKVGIYEIVEEALEEGISFNDIEGSYAEQEILAMAEAGLLQGTGDGNFEPKKGMSRADFTLLLSRIAGVDLEAGVDAMSFTDVEPSDYYAAAVEWAASLGIVQGKGNGEFQPKAGITREQMATMIVRFAAAMEFELPKLAEAVAFTDAASIGDYAKEAVAAAQQAGILSGKPNANGIGVSFDPHGQATREQTAKMIAGFLDILFPE